MNKQRYIALLQNPTLLSKEDIPDLEELIAQFPYCQNAYILLAKIQSDNGSMHAAKLSRKAALYTSDRNKLKNLLNNKPSYAKPAVEILVPKILEQPIRDEVITAEERPLQLIDQQPELTVSKEQETTIAFPEATESILPVAEESIIEVPAQKTLLSDIRIEADKNANAFLEELEENLKKLKESRARAVGLLPPFSKEQVDEINRTNPPQEKSADPLSTIPEVIDTVPIISTIVIEEKPAEEIISSKELLAPTATDPDPIIISSVTYSDRGQKNDVLDLILSFDNRVRDYFDINQYSSKNNPPVVPTTKKEAENTDSFIASENVHGLNKLPFNNKDWNLEESRMEESTKGTKDSLLLNYLEYIRDQKSKKQKPDKTREKSIISRFIQKDPTISPLSANMASSEDEEDTDNGSKNSNQSGFISETFAVLLEKQGKIEKAIRMYEELCLKNPEKKSYFAIRIQELKKKYNIQ